MAVLIFGVAASPVLSNGLVFAQSEEKYTDKEKKEQRSDEAKQQRIETQDKKPQQTQTPKDKKEQRVESSKDKKETSVDKKEISKDKREISKDKKEQRRANFEEKKAHYMEKFSKFSAEKKQKMQDRLDAMIEKRDISNQNIIKERHSSLTIQERQAEIDKIREERKLEREAQVNMTMEEKQASLAKLKEKMQERRALYASPSEQMSLGLAPHDVICAEDREKVIRVSNGMPTCLVYDTAVLLIDRGLVTYPE